MLEVRQSEVLALACGVDPHRVAFEQSKRDTELSARCLLAAFAYIGIPETLLDVGCGPGHLVRLSRSMGVEAVGVDQFASDNMWLACEDLTCLKHLPPVEAVICWEVAEHIESKHADHLCDLLVGATQQYLLFSAAIPNQGGSGHVNEQPHTYWEIKLSRRGLELDVMLTSHLRRVFTDIASRAWWYGQNIMAFKEVQQ